MTGSVTLADGNTATVGTVVKVVAHHFGFDGKSGEVYKVLKVFGKQVKLLNGGGDTIPASKCVLAE